jgi:hypothetical protein
MQTAENVSSEAPVVRILTERPPTSTASTALSEDVIPTLSCRIVPLSKARGDIANPILGLSTDGQSAVDDHHFPAGLVGLYDAMRLADLLEAKHA